MKNSVAFLVVAIVSLAGCATTKDWVATGGSRADGVIKLSYEYSLFQKPQLDAQQGLEVANQDVGLGDTQALKLLAG